MFKHTILTEKVHSLKKKIHKTENYCFLIQTSIVSIRRVSVILFHKTKRFDRSWFLMHIPNFIIIILALFCLSLSLQAKNLKGER